MLDLTKDGLVKMYKQEERDFVLINVLDNDAFNQSHIRNSINVPADQPQFVQMVNAVAGEKNREIILYDANPDSDASARAGRKLEDAGFSRIYIYHGGTADWFGMQQDRTEPAGMPPEHREWLNVVGSESKPSSAS